jgi:hypothetical protein
MEFHNDLLANSEEARVLWNRVGVDLEDDNSEEGVPPTSNNEDQFGPQTTVVSAAQLKHRGNYFEGKQTNSVCTF